MKKTMNNIDEQIAELENQILILKRSKQLSELKPTSPELVDWSRVYDSTVRLIESRKMADENTVQWLFEATLEVIYGNDVWGVYNQFDE